MTRIIWLAVVTLALAIGSETSAFAQDSLLQDLYGRGVHAYFARSYAEAHRHLTAAIEQGSRDPRCYYFRGLTYNRLGRPQEARADFAKGAELEATAGDQYYDVANALQRIQGSERIALEDTRRSARLAVRQRTEDVKRVRYEDFTKSQPEVIRGPQKGQPSRVVKQPTPPAATGDANGDDLFDSPPPKKPAAAATVAADDGAMPAEKPAAAPPSADDPFGDAPPAKTAGKPAMPAEADPFGDEPAKPAAKPAAPAADDPFGEMPAKPAAPAAEADPFGDAPAKPAPKPAAPAADDPFGEMPAKPAAPKPAADDPFGDEKPADGKMKADKASDPFADDPADKPGEMKKDDGEMKDDGMKKKDDAKKNDDPFG